MRRWLSVALGALLAVTAWGQPSSDFVTIPEGEHFIGALPEDQLAWPDEKPGRSVRLRKYQISLHEVTNAQFAQFVADTGYRALNPDWRKYARWGPQAPVVSVAWSDAAAYCKWAKARLPSEEEWERAARGPTPRIYPWGNEWNPALAVWSTDRPAPVGSIPAGRSPTGCYDMAGNVWEWTSTRLNDGSYILRGGCWGTNFPRNLRCSDRNKDLPGNGGNWYIGFRCAR